MRAAGSPRAFRACTGARDGGEGGGGRMPARGGRGRRGGRPAPLAPAMLGPQRRRRRDAVIAPRAPDRRGPSGGGAGSGRGRRNPCRRPREQYGAQDSRREPGTLRQAVLPAFSQGADRPPDPLDAPCRPAPAPTRLFCRPRGNARGGKPPLSRIPCTPAPPLGGPSRVARRPTAINQALRTARRCRSPPARIPEPPHCHAPARRRIGRPRRSQACAAPAARRQ